MIKFKDCTVGYFEDKVEKFGYLSKIYSFNKAEELCSIYNLSEGIHNLLNTENYIFKAAQIGDHIHFTFYKIHISKITNKFEVYGNMIQFEEDDIEELDNWVFKYSENEIHIDEVVGVVLKDTVYFDEQIYFRKLRHDDMINKKIITNNSYKWFGVYQCGSIVSNTIDRLDSKIVYFSKISDSTIRELNLEIIENKPIVITDSKIKVFNIKPKFASIYLNIFNTHIKEMNIDLTEMKMDMIPVTLPSYGIANCSVDKINVYVTEKQRQLKETVFDMGNTLEDWNIEIKVIG